MRDQIVFLPMDSADENTLLKYGFFRTDDGSVLRDSVRKYPKNLWSLLDKYGCPDEDHSCASNFNARLIAIHQECMGRSKLLFDVKVEELEHMWERFLLSDDSTFEEFLGELLTYHQVHEPTDEVLAIVDAVRSRKGLDLYRQELERLDSIRRLSAASQPDPDEAYGIEAEVMISFVDYVSTVGMETATCVGWEILGWAIRYRQTSLAVINEANCRINQLISSNFTLGVVDKFGKRRA